MEYKICKERTHLFAPSCNVAIKATLSPRCQQDALESAIRTAAEHNEALCCRVVIDADGGARYVSLTADELPRIALIPYDCPWTDVARREEKRPFRYTEGELARFFVRQSWDATELLIIAHHLAGDGLGLVCFIQDIQRALSGAALERKKLKQFNLSAVPKKGRLNPLTAFMLARMNKAWRKSGKAFSYQDYQRLHEAFWRSRDTMICEEGLNAADLLAFARKNNITVNSVLAAALTHAAGDSAQIGLTVSLREKGNESLSNLATAITVKCVYDPAQTFGDNARAIHRAIESKLQSDRDKYFLTSFMSGVDETLIDGAYFAAYDHLSNRPARSAAALFGYGSRPTAANLSNLSRLSLSFDKADAPHVTALTFLPPIIPNAAYILGAATLGDRLALTLHAFDDEDSDKRKALFAALISALKRLA